MFHFYSVSPKEPLNVIEKKVDIIRISSRKFFDIRWRMIRGGETGVWEYSKETIM